MTLSHSMISQDKWVSSKSRHNCRKKVSYIEDSLSFLTETHHVRSVSERANSSDIVNKKIVNKSLRESIPIPPFLSEWTLLLTLIDKQKL
jgi:hypothetical protein